MKNKNITKKWVASLLLGATGLLTLPFGFADLTRADLTRSPIQQRNVSPARQRNGAADLTRNPIEQHASPVRQKNGAANRIIDRSDPYVEHNALILAHLKKDDAAQDPSKERSRHIKMAIDEYLYEPTKYHLLDTDEWNAKRLRAQEEARKEGVAFERKPENTSYLIKNLASINSNKDNNPLQIVQNKMNHEGGIHLMYKDPDTGNTLLHVAAENGNADIVEYLLSLEAPVTIKNNSKQTPFELARAKFTELNSQREMLSADTATALKRLDAVIKVLEPAVEKAKQEARKNAHELIIGEQKLMSFETDVIRGIENEMVDIHYQEPKSGNTLLHVMATGECPNTVKALIYAGASLTIKNRNNQTPLQFARAILKDIQQFLQAKSIRSAIDTQVSPNGHSYNNHWINIIISLAKRFPETIQMLEKAEAEQAAARRY
jgi:hypothetical protein